MVSVSKTAHPSFSNVLRRWRTMVTKPPSRLDETDLSRIIKQNTELSTYHLTPELRLHLITPNCPLWSAPHTDTPFPDPFWAFYWPGGQAISRYILDHPSVVENRRVLDFGCGSGACGLAAAAAGASRVTLNDIDPVACVAARLNAEENGASVEISSENLLDRDTTPDWDLMLIGDMFYDESFATVLFDWLKDVSFKGCSVLIGDPGRHALSTSVRSKLVKLSEYSLPKNCCLENRGFSSAVVWRLNL